MTTTATPSSSERVSQTIHAFLQGLELELQAQKQQARDTELKVVFAEALESENGKYKASYHLERESEAVLPGAEGKLLGPEESEWEVTVSSVEGTEVVLSSPQILQRGEFRLSLSPWFLFQRMQDTLEAIRAPENTYSGEHALQAFGLTAPSQLEDAAPLLPHLNAAQSQAVATALSHSASRIWGPPGTGKTTTLAVLVEQLCSEDGRLLITSNTHGALDQVLSGMLKSQNLKEMAERGEIIRLGRCLPEHRPYSLSSVTARKHSQLRSLWEHAQERLEELKERLKLLQVPLKELRLAAEASDQLSLFGESQEPSLPDRWWADYFPGRRGERLSQMKPLAQLEVVERQWERLKALRRGYFRQRAAYREQMNQRRQDTVSSARIVLSTLANLTTSPWMVEERFHSVIVEEAGMALLPALFSATARATRRTVVVGDPKQLPSILVSRNSFVRKALGRNIFELGADCVPTVMLDTQYRMHPEIGALVSDLSYGGRLKDGLQPELFQEWSNRDPVEGKAVAGFELDGASECLRREGRTSRYNEVTAKVCLRLAERAAAAGFESIAVITPYREQVRTLLKMRSESLRELLECDTVHRFQGKERQVVILDLVDAESLGPGTLLRDGDGTAAQLLNVALSRAQYKLFLVGELRYLYQVSPESFVGRAVAYLSKRKWLYKVKPG